MTRGRFTAPEWLITIGGVVFIFALIVSAVFVPALRWLHVVQASMYVAAILLSVRPSRWGYFIGASAAALWNVLTMFGSPLFADLIDHPARPDLVLQCLGWLGNLAIVIGSVVGYRRLTGKSARDIGRLVLSFVGATALLAAATAILAPDYLVHFAGVLHPHWPWNRS